MTAMANAIDMPQPLGPQGIPRDGWKRPLVIPPGGIKAIGYTRCTTFVDCLDDRHHLEAWLQRQTALGLAERPDLLLSVTAHRDDKQTLNNIVEQAREAAKSSASATTGTALHALCERLDRGQVVGTVPTAYRQDIRAYQAITRGMTHEYIETFTVYDPYKVGGTPDRVVKWGDKYYIADLKTGSIEWSGLKIAMQLAMYAHSVPYNYILGKREPYPFDVDTERAIVIHLPAGEGIAFLHWANIDAGWEAVHTARDVRKWRSRKDWFEAIEMPPPAVDAIAADTITVSDDPFAGTDPVEDRIRKAASYSDLRAVWEDAVKHAQWTNEHINLAARRRAEIEGTAA